MSNVILTGKISLGVQFVVGIFDFYALTLPRSKDVLLRDLVKLELVVQTVEFIFYSWMVRSWGKHGLQNIVQYRYYDWMITTPAMLITLMAFLGGSPTQSLESFVSEHSDFIIGITSLNFSMLLLGLGGELQCISQTRSVILGFIPFFIYFVLIYNRFIAEQPVASNKVLLFYFFFIIWSIYGVVALFPPNPKNTSYNILDLFSKNLLGVILSVLLINRSES
jgi:bacteriorhodopsin